MRILHPSKMSFKNKEKLPDEQKLGKFITRLGPQEILKGVLKVETKEILGSNWKPQEKKTEFSSKVKFTGKYKYLYYCSGS